MKVYERESRVFGVKRRHGAAWSRTDRLRREGKPSFWLIVPAASRRATGFTDSASFYCSLLQQIGWDCNTVSMYLLAASHSQPPTRHLPSLYALHCSRRLSVFTGSNWLGDTPARVACQTRYGLRTQVNVYLCYIKTNREKCVLASWRENFG